MLEAFGAWGEKKLYGKTMVGVIRSTFVLDPDGRVEQAMHGVKATATSPGCATTSHRLAVGTGEIRSSHWHGPKPCASAVRRYDPESAQYVGRPVGTATTRTAASRDEMLQRKYCC